MQEEIRLTRIFPRLQEIPRATGTELTSHQGVYRLTQEKFLLIQPGNILWRHLRIKRNLEVRVWEDVLRTLSDYFTKFVDAIALLDKEAPSVASALFKVNDTKLYEYLNSAAE